MTAKKTEQFESLSPGEFNFAVDSALPRDQIIYHVGNLAADRLRRPRVDAIASYINSRAMKGHVLLVQRRVGINAQRHRGVNVFEYVAVKAEEPRPLPANLWDGIPQEARARLHKKAA